MKLLVVSNLYPPFFVGGYELRCSWVCEELVRRGHVVEVLCSRYGRAGSACGPEIHNGVLVRPVLTDWYQSQNAATTPALKRWGCMGRDIRILAQCMRESAPDVVCWWNVDHLSKAILLGPTLFGVPAVVWVEDLWMLHIQPGLACGRRWLGDWILRHRDRPLGRYGLALLRHVFASGIPLPLGQLTFVAGCFISAFQREANAASPIRILDKRVIHGAPLPLSGDSPAAQIRPESGTGPIQLVYCGSITECRRLHVLIEALAGMAPSERTRFRLSVVGQAPAAKDQAYLSSLEGRIRETGLQDTVTFAGVLPHQDVLRIFSSHDLFILCSTRPEGFPIAMAEAMMHGCLAISTGAGGAREMSELCGAPICPPDDPMALREMLLSYSADRNLLTRKQRECQQSANMAFSFSNMVSRYEEVLVSAAHPPLMR